MTNEERGREDERAVEPDDEREDASAPDAPPATEENEGMSTILSADTADGVQKNASDE